MVDATDMTIDAGYYMLGKDATYEDASGDRQVIRVIQEDSDETLISADDASVRGMLCRFRFRQSEVDRRPRQGESLEVNGTCMRIDGAADLNKREWLVYVTS